MRITVKELAKRLGISTAAVSMALNGKQGVSEETRQLVLRTARELGYDFSKIKSQKSGKGRLYYLIYKKEGAVVDTSPFFAAVFEGVAKGCSDKGIELRVIYLNDTHLKKYSMDRSTLPMDCIGILLLGTEMSGQELKKLMPLPVPMMVLDSYFETLPCDSMVINNRQGAFLAAHYLIKKYGCTPGYLKSSYRINNFTERANGFRNALLEHGLSPDGCVEHALRPSIEGACADMKRLLQQGVPLARCYFADSDYIAIGAMRAFQEAGLRVPEDVALIGFDDVPACQAVNPQLSTIHVPQQYFGEIAVLRLLYMISRPDMPFVKSELMTSLVERGSC